MEYKTIDQIVGGTPLIRLQRQETGDSLLLAKLEGHTPAGSVKDRPALSMIRRARERGELQPGEPLVEATSGNTGIALAMAAAVMGHPITLIMPENASEERRAVMAAFGAEVVLTPAGGGMESARDEALERETAGRGKVLNQFANPDNPLSHYETTGPEIWEQTGGTITHFVSAMGTTGTIVGTGRYLKERNPAVMTVGAEPAPGARIPGIRKWPEAYRPDIFDPALVDRKETVTQEEAEETARRLAREEGLFCGISSGGSVAAALRICRETAGGVVVAIICDRGDRYLSTGVFPPT